MIGSKYDKIFLMTNGQVVLMGLKRDNKSRGNEREKMKREFKEEVKKGRERTCTQTYKYVQRSGEKMRNTLRKHRLLLVKKNRNKL